MLHRDACLHIYIPVYLYTYITSVIMILYTGPAVLVGLCSMISSLQRGGSKEAGQLSLLQVQDSLVMYDLPESVREHRGFEDSKHIHTYMHTLYPSFNMPLVPKLVYVKT